MERTYIENENHQRTETGSSKIIKVRGMRRIFKKGLTSVQTGERQVQKLYDKIYAELLGQSGFS